METHFHSFLQSGRHFLGVDRKFIKYQADAHYNSRKYFTTLMTIGVASRKDFSPDDLTLDSLQSKSCQSLALEAAMSLLDLRS